MPNGGDVPSCPFCQYAQESSEFNTIECQKHKIKITFSHAMFCADLSHPKWPGMAQEFISSEGIPAGIMYTWVGVYTHQKYPLAPIETYAAWSDEEKEVHRREKQDDWETKYRSIYGDDAWF